MAKKPSDLKRFMLVNEKCYNIIIVEAKNKKDAFEKANKIMQGINKFADFELKDVIELCGTHDKNKTFIYRCTDDVKDVWVKTDNEKY